MRARRLLAALACLLLTGSLIAAAGASAYRQPLVQAGSAKGEEDWLPASQLSSLPEKQIEGACGLAISPTPTLFVSDYYHRAVHSFGLGGTFEGSQQLAGGDPRLEVNTLNAVCGLAADATGNLYASEFHQAAMRLRKEGSPKEEVIDPGESTGVAVDGAGNLYVDDRTYVAVYDAPVTPGDLPARKLGLGNLADAYGVAVDSAGARVYVPDAASETVKLFEPAVSPSTPVVTIPGPAGPGFHSLVDAAAVVDNSATEGKGHLLVVDDLKPGFERPEAAVYEFAASGTYLDRLQTRTVGPVGDKEYAGPIFGDPSGIAVDPSGNLYVTTGNSAKANVVAYGPFQNEPPPPGGSQAGSGQIETSRFAAGMAATEPSAARRNASASVVVQHRGVRVSFDGKLTPHALPRHGAAPVGIVVDAAIGATGGEDPPQLRRISIAINRNGHFNPTGLPVCRLGQIQPSTTAGALAACRPSLVGEGQFSANVKLPQQSPFPSAGKVLAFNGRLHGKPAILAHIYGTKPVPTSTVLPFLLRGARGTYGTTLEASLPQATGNWGYVTGLRMSLRRRFSYRGRARSYLSAGCPAPAGFPSAAFPLARTSFAFAGGLTLTSVLNRSCRAKG